MKKTSTRNPSKWKINFQTNEHIRKSKIQSSTKLKWQKLKLKPVAFTSLRKPSFLRRFEKKKVNRQFAECLQAKQAFKQFYGFLNDNQFNSILQNAINQKDPQASLILNLESRLETVLFRSGVFCSMFQSRQAVQHGKILICSNQKNNFIQIIRPGYLLKPGDLILHNQAAELSRNLDCSENFALLDNYICILNQPTLSTVSFPFKVNLNLILHWIRYV